MRQWSSQFICKAKQGKKKKQTRNVSLMKFYKDDTKIYVKNG